MISVLFSLLLIRRRELPFTMSRDLIRWDGGIVKRILVLGTPIALQDLLVGISFLVVLAIVNSLGLITSAGVGVAERVCGFIMLVPSAFSQSMSAFAAQNRGAGRNDRAVRGLWYAIGISTLFGVLMFYAAFFHGDLLASIFAKDPEVMKAIQDAVMKYIR
jgi:Na+-driven multidrug efflux pump